MTICICRIESINSYVEGFFIKQKTAYEMRISDWSSDVCSSDLDRGRRLGYGEPRGTAEQPAPSRGSGRRSGGAREPARAGDRKSVVSGKSVSVRVDLGGRRFIKKINTSTKPSQFYLQTYIPNTPLCIHYMLYTIIPKITI